MAAERMETIDSAKVPCSVCNAMILPATARETGGLCMPCFRKPLNPPTDEQSKDCWFCEQSPVGQGASLAVMLDRHQENIIEMGRFKGYKYKRTSVFVPRCRRCESVHERWRNSGEKGAGIGVLLGLFAGTAGSIAIYQMGDGLGKAVGMFFGNFVGSIFVCFALGAFIGWVRPRPREVSDRRHGYKYSAVQEMVEQGWAVSTNQDPKTW